MVSGAIGKGFIPQYVLADSWFITDRFIKSIVNLGRKRKGRIDVLGLMKGGRKVEYQGKIFTTDILPKIFQSKTKACRRMKCRYLMINVTYKGTPIKLFLVMMNGQTTWKLLVTTDERLSFVKAMEYYQIRWTIEVFFGWLSKTFVWANVSRMILTR